MARQLSGDALALGRRLRELRESRFPGVTITQRALGEALGGDRPIKAPQLSSWEKGTAIPTERWIAAYAAFFATSRSVEGEQFRLLGDDDLYPSELADRDALRDELLSLRTKARTGNSASDVPEAAIALGGSWRFDDGAPIRIICAGISKEQLNSEVTPTHPRLAFGELYAFSSIDALVELFGHIRAANPRSDVRLLKAHEVEPDDLAAHLVSLGGVDLNPFARRLPTLLPEFPVEQISDGLDPRDAYFEVSAEGEKRKYSAALAANDELIHDVGLFVRAPNPANERRTLTICNAMYSLGTWGVVRTLTDERFRDRNEEYIRERFPGQDAFGILMKVLIFNGYEAVTPDWTVPTNRLYEWPERIP